MNMIKSYTDLEQSNKLMEVLPLDSADMYYDVNRDGILCYPQVIVGSLWNKDIPCWSLPALFEALPKTIGTYSKMMSYFDDAYHCGYIDEDGECIGFDTMADNLVDAVYKMILKLKDNDRRNEREKNNTDDN